MVPQAPAAHRGPSRLAVASLAMGGYLLLAGIVFQSPFLRASRAIQNDVFLTNLFIAPLYCVLGGLLLLAGLLGARGHWRRGRGSALWRPLLLAVAGAGVLLLVYYLFGSRYYAYQETSSSLPPYLNVPVLVASLALGVVIFLAGWVWSGRSSLSHT